MPCKYFNNFGYLERRLPETLFNEILDDCLSAETGDSHVPMISGLSGTGTPTHYWLKDPCKSKLQSFTLELVSEYENEFHYLNKFKNNSSSTPLICKDPWINIQSQGEFIPVHEHDGVLSYSLWVKIPYDIDEELKNSQYASTFQFLYQSITGDTMTSAKINVSKQMEGIIIMFPSSLKHCVYPYYTTKEKRISVSGNILLNTGNNDGD